MTGQNFPWKRNFIKPSSSVSKALEEIPSPLIQVAESKKIKKEEIASGLYAHVGVTVDIDGNIVIKGDNVPKADAGKWSARNKFGWEIVRKDLPMTTKSFSFEAPNFGDAARNGTSMRIIQRDVYQRQVFEPRGILVSPEIISEDDKQVVVKFSVNEVLDRNYKEFDRLLLWSLNILQENTGVAGVYPVDASKEDFLKTITLSWEVFPPGTVEEVIARLSEVPASRSNAPDFEKHVRERVKLFEKLKPVGYLRGQGGFGSYFGAQFADDLVVFENLRYGNAIYILYENWEDISKRSRLDLLRDNDAQFDRIPHVADWQERLQKLIRFQLRKRRRPIR